MKRKCGLIIVAAPAYTVPEQPSSEPEEEQQYSESDPGQGSTTLPDSHKERNLSDMKVGETAYTTPWGMWVDLRKHAWLHPEYPAAAHQMGTIEMKVQRKADGYYVWLVPGEDYTPRSEPGYVSPADTKYIPVVAMYN